MANVGDLARGGLLSSGASRAAQVPLYRSHAGSSFRRHCSSGSRLYVAPVLRTPYVLEVSEFRGDDRILPAIHLLTGCGLILMLALRDPL